MTTAGDLGGRTLIGRRDARSWWIPLTAAGCFVFGLCLTLNSQNRVSGVWPLYIEALLHGAKLYTDLRSPLQPFFFLERLGWRWLFGPSWLAEIGFGAFHLTIYLIGYSLLIRKSTLSAANKALVLITSFMVGIGYNFYMFNDYRVTADIQYIFSAILLFDSYDENNLSLHQPLRFSILGLMAGICFCVRPNDGFFLALADAMILLSRKESRRILPLAIFGFSLLLSVAMFVILSADSISSYVNYALIEAAEIKGGTNQLALSPLALFLDDFKTIFHEYLLFTILATIIIIAIPWLLYKFLEKALNFSPRRRMALTLSVAVGFGSFGIWFMAQFDAHGFLRALAPIPTLVMFGLGAAAALATIGVIHSFPRQAPIVFLPIGLIASGALSSGGHALGNYGALGLFIALTPVVFPGAFQRTALRVLYLSLCAVLAASGALAKVMDPANWEYYRTRPMFTEREWVTHPLYGPMYIDRGDEGFFTEVCNDIGGFGARTTLLSTPFPFANYYCGVPPWRRLVQTWFDLTSAATIRNVGAALRQDPPTWILYERQLPYLRGQECSYNHGRRMSYRDVDDLIMGKLDQRAWSVKAVYEPLRYDHWMLIKTSPAAPGVGAANEGFSAALMELNAAPCTSVP